MTRPTSPPAAFLKEFVSVAIVLAALALLHSPAVRADGLPAGVKPVRVRLEGVITPLAEQTLFRTLDRAKEMHADLIIVEIDSPGGMLKPSMEIANRLRELDWAKTVAWVPKEALSGGAFVALGCDAIVLKPHARIGDAGPIVLGEDGLFRHAPEKIVSDLAVFLRSLAEAKRRPPALAEAMVDKTLEVYRYTNAATKEARFRSPREVASDAKPAEWTKGQRVLEAGPGRFLEVIGNRALELGLAQAVADDLPALVAKLKLPVEPMLLADTWVDHLVAFLNHPLVTGLLIVTGLVCLYLEFAVAGMGLAALPAALCFMLFFWSRFLGGTAGWLEVLLFLGGIVCLILELFVIPGFGVVGLTGLIMLGASLLMASQGFVLPRTGADLKLMGQWVMVFGCAGVVFLGTVAFITRNMESLPGFRRFVLKPGDDEGFDAPPTDAAGQPIYVEAETLIHRHGVATTDLRPAGKIRLDGRTLDVVADGFFIAAGQPVQVIQVAGNRIVVKQV